MALSVLKCVSAAALSENARSRTLNLTQPFRRAGDIHHGDPLNIALRGVSCAIIMLLLFPRISRSQELPGVQLFSTNEFGVDIATGAVNVSIPLRSKAGKIPFWSKLVGTSGMSQDLVYLGDHEWDPMFRLKYQDPTIATVTFTVAPPGLQVCYDDGHGTTYYKEPIRDFSVTDATGGSHLFGAEMEITDAPPNTEGCPNPGNISPTISGDASGYTMTVISGALYIYDRAGNYLEGTCNLTAGCQLATILFDPDSASISDGSGGVTDSLNTSVLSFALNTYSYLDVNNGTEQYTTTITNCSAPH